MWQNEFSPLWIWRHLTSWLLTRPLRGRTYSFFFLSFLSSGVAWFSCHVHSYWKDTISDLWHVGYVQRGSSPEQHWCNFTGDGLSFSAFTHRVRQWPNFYEEQISFPLLISHNAFLRCANKLPRIHIHKPQVQTNDELPTLSQQKAKWNGNGIFSRAPYHTLTIGVLSCVNSSVCVRVALCVRRTATLAKCSLWKRGQN